jgi:hypothetical protein
MKEVREARKRESAERAARAKEQREREKAIAQAELEVVRLESIQRKLLEELEAPASYDDPSVAARLNRELRDIQYRVAEATARWDQLAAAHAPEETAHT